MSAKLDSKLIVDENRQPIGRPWLSLAVHAACSQILAIKASDSHYPVPKPWG